MKLVAKRQCNHLVEVFQLGDQLRVKLSDESGNGGFVDASGVISQDGDWFVPLEGGGCTVTSTDDVLMIVRHLAMPIRRYEGWSGTEYTIEPGILPDAEAERHDLLTCGSKEVLSAMEVEPTPLWFQVREQARGATSLPLF